MDKEKNIVSRIQEIIESRLHSHTITRDFSEVLKKMVRAAKLPQNEEEAILAEINQHIQI